MLETKEKVLDRIEQTFILFKNNFKDFLLPIFLYNLVTTVLLFSIFSSIYFYINPIKLSTENITISIPILIYITIMITLFICYLTILIGFQLGLLKSIKQGINNETITVKENIFYGFRNILNSFNTYWYIFAYTLLIPSIIFIIGGFIFIISSIYPEQKNILWTIGGIIMGIGGLLSIFFLIYRGIKTSFSITSAIDKNHFNKNNFNFSIKITDKNWRRILGNFLLIGIILSSVSGLFSFIISIIGGLGNNIDYTQIKNIDDLKVLFQSFGDFNIFKILSNSLNLFIQTIITVFTTIFIYIFFKRLEFESIGTNTKSIPETIKINKTREL